MDSGKSPRFYATIADWNGEPAGMALYFFNYSTWVSRYGLYLEDLYVAHEHRKKGVAKGVDGPFGSDRNSPGLRPIPVAGSL